MSEQKLKVYQMNDYDFWADYSKDEAEKNYTEFQLEACGIDKEDIDVEDIVEISDERMNELKYVDDDGAVRTFKKELEKNPVKVFFASTES